MKRQFLGILLLLSFVSGVSAQKAQVADSTGQNLRKHVEYLASDKLEGRRTGEQGATFAAGYIANAFAKSKLKAGFRDAKNKPNFLQPFPYVSGVTLAPENYFHLGGLGGLGPYEAVLGTEWMPLGYSLNTSDVGTNIVFAGHGIVSPEAKVDDYSGRSVEREIAMVFDGTPDESNPHSPLARYNIHAKAILAKERGAAALIVIATEPDFKNDRLSRLAYDRSLGETALPTLAISRRLAAGLLGAKDEAELAEIQKTGQLKKLEASPPGHIAIRESAFARVKISLVKQNSDAYNVIGILEGTDPVLKNEAIVIGSHYDHLGRGGQGSLAINSSDIHNGADDNASGTAAVIELARQFAKEKKNKRTIIFIAFSGEEEGLLGSDYYVNNPVFPLDKTVAMINLDMVGRLKDEKLNVGGIGTASEWKKIVDGFNSSLAELITTKLGNKKYDDLTPGSEPRFALQLNDDGFGPSDHSSFYGKKIPVLFFFTGTHNDYHKPSDTSDKINYSGLSRVTHYVYDIVTNIDETEKRPTYTVAKSSGTMGRAGFNVSLGTVPNYADSTDGLLLDGVRDNSPAAKAGIKPGDKVIKLAGKDVRNVTDYTYILGEMKAGQEYEVVVLRGTERLTLKIIPAAAAKR